jgi:hypothetical protein
MQTCLLQSHKTHAPLLQRCCSVSCANRDRCASIECCSALVLHIQTLKRVRKADYADQISAVLFAADEDKLGRHAPDARAQLTTAAAAATTASEAAKRGADALEVSTDNTASSAQTAYTHLVHAYIYA